MAPDVRCITASGVPEALDLLKQVNAEMPDVIFLDLNMPGIDGKKCLAMLKADVKLKEIPVVIYSTSNYHKDIEETYKLGAQKFIIKPSDYTQLCNMFREMFT